VRKMLHPLLTLLGVEFHDDGDGRSFPSLGLDWNLTGLSPTVSLSPERCELARRVLDVFIRDAKEKSADGVSAAVAQCAAGLFAWIGSIIVEFATYRRAFVHWEKARRPWSATYYASHPELLEGVLALRQLLKEGVPMEFTLTPDRLPGAPIASRWRFDASTVIGFGALSPSKGTFISRKWTKAELLSLKTDRDRESSTLAEAWALLESAHSFIAPGHNMAETDSQPLRDAWIRGASGVPDLDRVLRQLRVLCVKKGARLTLRHVRRNHNQAADSLSKGSSDSIVFEHAAREFPGVRFCRSN
jgi:hypothetical protein